MTLGAALLTRAQRVVPDGFPISVVVAKREYEAWFLAALCSRNFRQGLERIKSQHSARALSRKTDVEAIADCKKRVAELILGTRYEETTHQKKLTEILPFTKAVLARSRVVAQAAEGSRSAAPGSAKATGGLATSTVRLTPSALSGHNGPGRGGNPTAARSERGRHDGRSGGR
jgi:hypothetical protein